MTETWDILCGDCLQVLRGLPGDCCDLVFGSPPYAEARLYLEGGKDLGIARKTKEWVAWMVEVYRECVRVCKGLVAFVVEGQTRKFRYSAGPALLMADLHRAGFNLRKPPIFHRVGIPGSGGPDWLRNDWEWIICVTRAGKLPWSDNTACGHTPKWAPGGEMSNRLSNGSRVNQWGHPIESGATVVAADGVVTSKGKRPSHRVAKLSTRHAEGKKINAQLSKRRVVRGSANGDTQTSDSYEPPTLANPGNVLFASDVLEALSSYAILTGFNSDALLSDMRKHFESARLPQWLAGVYDRVLEATFLRPQVQRHVAEASERPETWRASTSGPEDCSQDDGQEIVRGLREDDSAGGSSLRRGCDQQRQGQSGGSVPVVSPEEAQRRQVFRSRLQSAVLREGILQQALSAMEAVWRSFAEADAARGSGDCSNMISLNVGGGVMGNPLVHENEAGFPEDLAAFFVQSFCPPGGLVCDPFSGSGTTVAVSVRHGRRGLGIDLRSSQCAIARKRIAGETPLTLLG